MASDFTHRSVRALGGKTLHRLGLAPSFGLDEAGCAEALERGPLDAEEQRWMREFGRKVHGEGRGSARRHIQSQPT